MSRPRYQPRNPLGPSKEWADLPLVAPQRRVRFVTPAHILAAVAGFALALVLVRLGLLR